MATVVRMPSVMAGATEAALQSWLIGVGDTVTEGQAIAEIETDKAVFEHEAEAAGTVAQLLVEPGVAVAVGAPIAVLADAGEKAEDAVTAAGLGAPAAAAAAPDAAAPDAAVPDAAVPDAAVPEAAAPEAAAPEAAAPEAAAPVAKPAGGRLFASPLVRRLAQERGLDLTTIRGTGPNGRIVRRDLDGLQAPPPPVLEARPATASAERPEPERVPLTRMRAAIARRLTESKATVPHFYVSGDCRMERLLALRSEINEVSPGRISVNDLIVKAVALALRDVPAANVTWGGESILRHRTVDVAVAVAVDDGLLTPVVQDADRLGIVALSEAIADLAERARSGRLRQQELEGGSFSVSNLGMYGVGAFSAILNPPQAGVLAVAAAKERPVVEDGALAVGTVMSVTLSADHRVIDGAVAAEWMAAFVRRIESPLSLLV
ncbi:MAG TPA: dihydrolipoamide acetyltransferase family protein [Microbacterium sp.]|nr:dihydrolipoamide acetyltransferase family protein [Microbacterium sp.]